MLPERDRIGGSPELPPDLISWRVCAPPPMLPDGLR